MISTPARAAGTLRCMRRIAPVLFLVAVFGSAGLAQSWPDKLADAVEKKTLGEQVTPLAGELKQAIENPDFDKQKLIDLAAYYRFAAFFSRVELTDAHDTKCLQWLIRQPKLSRAVCLAVSDADQPDKVLGVLRPLYRTDRETMEKWPDLVAALAVVWDAPQLDTSEDTGDAIKARGDWAINLYHYFTHQNDKLRYSVKDMPWQLQTYVVDLSVSKEELEWVWSRYGRRGDVGAFYFDVPYDTDAFYTGAERKIEGLVYTLDNLQKHGGICVDQAYFATQVGRSLGVPVVTIIGQGGAGEVAHAWVGYLDRRGKQLVWNLRSGRYEHQLYWTGQVQDPQSRKMISESETSLLAELQNTTPESRDLAQALIRSIDLFDAPKQPEIVFRALELSAGNREAWLKLGDLGAQGQLTDKQAERAAEVIKSFASKQYADLAFEVYKRMISGKSNLQQLDQYDWLATVFKERPDLVAQIRVEQGKLHHGLKNDPAALRAYGDVLTNHLYAGPIILDALRLTDGILRQQKDLKRLAAIYDKLFASVPKPQPSAFASYAPFCQIGQRYAELLDDMGDHANAQKVRQRIATYDKSVPIGNNPNRN